MNKEQLPRGNTTLSRDDRRISFCVLQNGNSYVVGDKTGVTDIIAYDENGEMSYIPWIAIYKGDFLFVRVSGRYLSEIVYEVCK